MHQQPNILKDGPVWELFFNDFMLLRDFIEGELLDIRDYVFRGQSNSEWKLTTSLDRLIRHARETGVKQGSIDDFVNKHLERFKLEIRGRRGDNPPKLEENELWALGQHYGLATPLLDWSLSPYIALFFALESISRENDTRALWCLNRRKVDMINTDLNEWEWLEFIVPNSDENKRLLGQSGLFSKGPVMNHVDDWVREKAANASKVLIKITFPGDRGFRKPALKKLQLMNITHSTLFPDLSGASLFCNIIAEDYEV